MYKVCSTQSHGLARGTHRHNFWKLHPDLLGISHSHDSPNLILAIFRLFHKRKTPQRKKITRCGGHQEQCKYWTESLQWLLCANIRNTYSQRTWFSQKIKQLSSYFMCICSSRLNPEHCCWPHIPPQLLYKHMQTHTGVCSHISVVIYIHHKKSGDFPSIGHK
jgi:hypothetical protein